MYIMDKKELAHYVQKLQSGDISAFEVIYNETNNQVYNLLYSYTKNEYTSLDLMQETYLTVNSKIETLKDSSAIKSWINRIAINKANTFLVKNKREILLSEEGKDLFENQLEIDEEFLPQEILDSKEKQKIIKDIVDSLPMEQKTAVYLYYFDELSLGEVAKDMECSEGTVKSRLNYARKKIKVEVDTWEKKGTKLYGTGVPVLLLLLRNQLGIQQIDLKKTDVLLRNMIKNIGEGSVLNTLHQISNSSDKVSNATDCAVKTSKKLLGIKAAISGGIIVAVIAGAVLVSRPSPVIEPVTTQVPSKPVEIKKSITYLSYSELFMDSGISTIDVSGDEIMDVNNLINDKCIEILPKDEVDNGKAKIELKSVDGRENTINVGIDHSETEIGYGGPSDGDGRFYAYKQFTNNTIASISDYDQSIAQITNDSVKKAIKIMPLKEGSIKIKIIDDKGLVGELEFEINGDKITGYRVSEKRSSRCK